MLVQRTIKLQTFYDTLVKCSKAYGIQINEPMYVEVEAKDAKTYVNQVKENYFKECQIVVAMLNRKTQNFYKDLK